MRPSFCLATMLVTVSTAGFAQIASAAGAPASSTAGATATVESKPKPICRRELVTGSNMPKRTCHSAAEWKQIDNPSTEERRARADQVKPNF